MKKEAKESNPSWVEDFHNDADDKIAKIGVEIIKQAKEKTKKSAPKKTVKKAAVKKAAPKAKAEPAVKWSANQIMVYAAAAKAIGKKPHVNYEVIRDAVQDHVSGKAFGGVMGSLFRRGAFTGEWIDSGKRKEWVIAIHNGKSLV